jgi:23S rRNA pseudouridine1911/1915/1917 synthase
MSDEARLTVPDSAAGERIDRYLASALDASRAAVKRLFEVGAVRIEGRAPDRNQRLSGGETIVVSSEVSGTDFVPVASGRAPVVLYEDRDVLVLDKAAGVATQPLRADERDTLVNDLVGAYPDVLGVGYAQREPGILHRLDRGTSGAVLVARNAESFDKLRGALRGGAIEKEYLALAAGEVDRGGYECFLAPDPKNKKKVRATGSPARGARAVVTNVLEAMHEGELSFVRVSASAAYRHQIRAHLAFLGHPLAGDALYRGPAIEGLERHFLHASSIRFAHPRTGKRITVESPLPPELDAVLVRTGFEARPGR